jgi:hypothetical protein
MKNKEVNLRMKCNQYKLIWFQHFHKAAGSTIVEYALMNNEKLYPNHANGNPLEKDGSLINLHTFFPTELTEFVDDCEKNGVNFVATEWGAPYIDVLADDPRVKLITCLRDPLKRFLSNFYFDVYGNYTKAKKLENYVNSKDSIFTMDNYYSRILARHNLNPDPIDEVLFQKVKNNLSRFDCCFALEDGFESLSETLNWECPPIEKNHSKSSLRTYFRHLSRGQFQSILFRLIFRKKPPTKEFQDNYIKRNFYDYKIYEQYSNKQNLKGAFYDS